MDITDRTRVLTGLATRQGTSGPIADAATAYTSPRTGRTALALVDGIGHSEDIVRLAPMLAETAARVGAVRGALAGLLSAGLLVNDPGPDAVGVLAVTRLDGSAELVWAGDCRAYSFERSALTQLTTDHNLASYLSRVARGAEVPVAALADFVSVTLGLATPSTAAFVSVPAGTELLVITSDGIHDSVGHEELEAVVSAHQDDPQDLAEALVAAARPGRDGERDDATALVLRHP
ncbi:hypothetical protein [Kitasatospora sp. NPDC098663]|uniref:hypothetical protein n=1 Tax=Kitasatospora sp. NPDC098663 TaxID=3364096 RepID=UPI0038253B8D